MHNPCGGGGKDRGRRGTQGIGGKNCLKVYTKHWISLKYLQKQFSPAQISKLKP